MTAIPNCKQGLSKYSMRAISAPYNFTPLPGWVHIPEWSMQASHDHPFEDGVGGEIHYRLVAESPLLVGGRQEKNTGADRPNTEVFPFRLPDSRYAVPGSSLKGMLRAVVEIAGFGRMRMVDDRRPGLRDISGGSVSDSYNGKVRDKVKTGFLRNRDGRLEIVPCRMVRLSHRELESVMGVNKPIFRARIDVREKYITWEKACRKKGWQPGEIRFSVEDGDAVNLGRGATNGFPVFTGQISDSTKSKGKYKDFVFFDPDESRVIEVSDEAWRDFLLIHGDGEDSESGMSWPGYWKRKFREGREVPVFYLQDGTLLRIGLAYMPKLAGDFTIHDTIRHAAGAHLQPPGLKHGYDFADLLFGAVNGERQEDALRGRVSLETAVAEGDPEPLQMEDTILNGPKPTYFPNYLRQNTARDGSSLQGQYTTYMDTGGGRKPVARGFKRYPARPERMTGVQALTSEQDRNKKVQVRLHPLPAGAAFKGRIVFHNLRPEELGALLWAMTWGGDDGLRHALGMGKPFGFGQVRFEIDQAESRVFPNDPGQKEATLDAERLGQYRKVFVAHMEAVLKNGGAGEGWARSPQIANLLAMADPASAEELPKGMELRHMCLNAKEKVNEFVWAKQRGFVLRDYAGASRWSRRQEARRARLREEQEAREKERLRRAAEEAAAREKAEYDALPEHEKAMREVSRKLAPMEGRKPLNKDTYGEVAGLLRSFLEQSMQWPRDARLQIAEFIEEKLETLGWYPSGLKKNRREKRIRDWNERLDRLRE